MRTIVESARSMLHAKQLPIKFWAEAVNTAVYVLNCSGPSPVANKAPFELFFNKKPSIEHLRVFGSEVFVHVPKEKRRKCIFKGIFIGYCDDTKGYRVWIIEERKIEVSRDVVFREDMQSNNPIVSVTEESGAENFAVFGPGFFESENSIVYQNEQPVVVEPMPNSGGDQNESHTEQPIVVEPVQDDDFEDDDIFFETKSDSGDDSGSDIDKNRRSFVSQRTREQSHWIESMEIGYCFVSEKEPKNFEMALASDDSIKWKEAMDDEYNSLIENQTWQLVDLPRGHNLVDNKWVHKIKETPTGGIERYKARLVVRGFSQEYGVDYFQTYSPVVRYASIRTIMAMAAAENLKLIQFDVKTAFLYGDLSEDIYMKQPVGYEDGTSKVCKLRKSLYGLKQASRNWNEKFTKFLQSYNLKASSADPCVFTGDTERRIILGIFIDDGIVAATHEEDITNLMDYLTKEFKIRVMEAKSFVGLEIDRSQNGSIHLKQTLYTKKILEKFRMSDAKSLSTPAENVVSVSNELAKNYPFREAIGSLMFLAVGTRPDIAFAVGKASRSLSQPSEADVTAIKRIFKYLRGTLDFGIFYAKTSKFALECFSDSDYAGCPVTRRSTSGYVFNLGSGAISWCSQLQKCVVTSSTEVEYVAGSQSVKELLWLERLTSDLHIKCDSVCLHMDNQSAIRLVENSEPHKRTKHVDIKYHFIREKFRERLFKLNYVPTDTMVADILTKPLSRVKFKPAV